MTRLLIHTFVTLSTATTERTTVVGAPKCGASSSGGSRIGATHQAKQGPLTPTHGCSTLTNLLIRTPGARLKSHTPAAGATMLAALPVSKKEPLMARVMFTCPATGKPVFTEMEMDQ